MFISLINNTYTELSCELAVAWRALSCCSVRARCSTAKGIKTNIIYEYQTVVLLCVFFLKKKSRFCVGCLKGASCYVSATNALYENFGR